MKNRAQKLKKIFRLRKALVKIKKICLIDVIKNRSAVKSYIAGTNTHFPMRK